MYRVEPESLKVQVFEAYSPKIIANTKGLERVLEDRTIQWTMLRTKDEVKADRVIKESGEDWAEIRNMLYLFALAYFKEIRSIYRTAGDLDLGVTGRQRELWLPLLVIAKFIDDAGEDGLFELVRAEAVRKSSEMLATGLDEWNNALLVALKEMTGDNEENITNKKIKKDMGQLLDDDPPKAQWIGQALKRLRLVESRKRDGRGVIYTIRHHTVLDVMKRYSISTQVGV